MQLEACWRQSDASPRFVLVLSRTSPVLSDLLVPVNYRGNENLEGLLLSLNYMFTLFITIPLHSLHEG